GRRGAGGGHAPGLRRGPARGPRPRGRAGRVHPRDHRGRRQLPLQRPAQAAALPLGLLDGAGRAHHAPARGAGRQHGPAAALGTNMGRLLRWGNVTMAKLLELFWFWPHEPRLTDVGCSYRALWAETWRKLAPGTRESGPAFSPEMICEAYRQGMRVIEIPVHY